MIMPHLLPTSTAIQEINNEDNQKFNSRGSLNFESLGALKVSSRGSLGLLVITI